MSSSLSTQSLTRHRSVYVEEALDFETPALNAVREIWRHRNEKKGYVARADFDARTLKPFLRNLSILDVVERKAERRRYRYRYMGSAIVDIFGEQTGRYLDEFISSDRIAAWTTHHDLVVDKKIPLRFVVNYTTPRIDYKSSESLLLPLSETGDTVGMLMAFVYFRARNL